MKIFTYIMERFIINISIIIIIHNINCDLIIIIIIIVITMQWNKLIFAYIQCRKRKKEKGFKLSHYMIKTECVSLTNESSNLSKSLSRSLMTHDIRRHSIHCTRLYVTWN